MTKFIEKQDNKNNYRPAILKASAAIHYTI